MSELAADEIPVAVSLRVLKLSRQPYYRWRKHKVTASELRDAYRANALFHAHRDDPEFGSRLLAVEAHAAGEAMCERTAWRICRDNQWWLIFGKKRGENGKRPGPPVQNDLVKRHLTAEDVNELWLTDIALQAGGAPSGHWTDEGKLYLCAIKDVFSGRIVGYSMDSRMKARLAVNALVSAVTRRGGVAGCIVHLDRGSQFRARSFVHALNQHHLLGSIGQVGAAGDNAAMESFSALLQKNVLDRRRRRTRSELRVAIITWIERTPAPPAGPPGPIDPHRVRDHHEPDRHPGGLTPFDTSSRSSPDPHPTVYPSDNSPSRDNPPSYRSTRSPVLCSRRPSLLRSGGNEGNRAEERTFHSL